MFYDEYVKLCNQIGRSPSAVAESLGFQKSAVTRWKQGSTPTDNNKRKIAEYFGIPVSTFLTPTPVSPSPVAAPVQTTLAAAVTAPSATAPAGTAPLMSPIPPVSAPIGSPVMQPIVSPTMPSPISPTMPAPGLQPYPAMQPTTSPMTPPFAAPTGTATMPTAPTGNASVGAPGTVPMSTPTNAPVTVSTSSAPPSSTVSSPHTSSVTSPSASIASPATQSQKPETLSKPISLDSSTEKKVSSTIAVSHASTFTPIRSSASHGSYDRESLKIVLFGDSNIGDDLLDDVLSYAKFRQSLISKA